MTHKRIPTSVHLIRGVTLGLWVMVPLVGLAQVPYWFQVVYGISAVVSLTLAGLTYQWEFVHHDF